MTIKRKREIWEAETIVCENFECAILLATGVFHGSQFGIDFSRKFQTGDKVIVTVEHVRKSKEG